MWFQVIIALFATSRHSLSHCMPLCFMSAEVECDHKARGQECLDKVCHTSPTPLPPYNPFTHSLCFRITSAFVLFSIYIHLVFHVIYSINDIFLPCLYYSYHLYSFQYKIPKQTLNITLSLLLIAKQCPAMVYILNCQSVGN